jgi:hypothetical protein
VLDVVVGVDFIFVFLWRGGAEGYARRPHEVAASMTSQVMSYYLGAVGCGDASSSTALADSQAPG